MKPNLLTMQAFGSYGKKTVIDFTKVNQNLFLVTGDTGSGKSTVFDAIVFALYGETGSCTNKKTGTMLQSHYASYDMEPFVTLIFTNGPEGFQYQVTRVPRHEKVSKRGGTKSVREVTGSVSLVMPDGSVYPQKETNEKLAEIIGLTKEQFMQVAMIAQGEFMELLRADSNSKKEIFRKLFHTKLYEQITEELQRRRNEKQSEADRMKTECRTIVAGINIPEGYHEEESLSLLQKQILSENLANLNDFLSCLTTLCEETRKEKEIREKTAQKAEKQRDSKKVEVSNAEELLKFFSQLGLAEKELSEWSSEEEACKKKRKLCERLEKAYEVFSQYQTLDLARKHKEESKAGKEKQEKLLPVLKETEKETGEKVQEKKKIQETETANYHQLSTRVQKARELFSQLSICIKEQKEFEKKGKDAERKVTFLRQENERLNGLISAYEEKQKALSDAPVRLVEQNQKEESSEKLFYQLKKYIETKKKVDDQKETCIMLARKYQESKDAFLHTSTEYEGSRQQFLDEQAGILARELINGHPCPVCGATEHPNPSKKVSANTISKEDLKQLEKKVDGLRSLQEQAALRAKEEEGKYSEGCRNCELLLTQLTEQVSVLCPDETLIPSEKALEEKLSELQGSIKKEKEEAERQVKSLKKTEFLLSESKKELQNISVQAESIKEEYEQFRVNEEKSKAAIDTLSKQLSFSTLHDAEECLTEALSRKEKADSAFQEENTKFTNAVKEVTKATSLLQQYLKELPERELEENRQKDIYSCLLRESGFLDEEWRLLTEQYKRNEINSFRDVIKIHDAKGQTAKAMKASAEKAIGERQKPDLTILREELLSLEKEKEDKCKKLQEMDVIFNDNRRVFEALQPKLEQHEKQLSEFIRLDTLYKQVSGKITGSRMDLETFVQRYYLERILKAANRRFLTMSAGQFSLSLLDLSKAGDGKNRGLDLCVYSHVTGREREIRTLSGGESFMAALSLALGMADQIKESSTSVSLDIMFIDEGFGSLDDASRNQAVRVLTEMAEGSRMIGIISHVTELKQEIEAKLFVRKDEEGSHVQWQIS